MADNNKTCNIIVRVSQEFKDEAQKQAAKDNRTLSGYIINLIKTDMENKKQ